MTADSSSTASTPASPRLADRSGPLCEATCRVKLEIEGDRFIRVRGDEDDPFSVRLPSAPTNLSSSVPERSSSGGSCG
ncbi:MAG: hypothetical protein CL908_20395 [Deltaproteobacteria bacterium]|jgi:hypothetical protein|nr:hypothetical protein [Deltaproteobacteria bacterium]